MLKVNWKKVKTFDSSYFKNDSTQNYSVFQPIHRYFVGIISDPDSLVEWKSSKRLSNESIKPPRTGSNFLGPLLDYLGNKIKLK